MATLNRTRAQTTTYTNITDKCKDRVTRTPLKTGSEVECSEWISSSCCTSDIRRATLDTKTVISHE